MGKTRFLEGRQGWAGLGGINNHSEKRTPKKKQQNKGRVNLGALYRYMYLLVRAAASALVESAVGMPSASWGPGISGSFLISVFHPKQDRCMRDKAVARITYWRCEISDGTLMHMQVHRGTCFSRINQNNSLTNGNLFQIWAKRRYLSLVSKLPWLMRIPRGTYCCQKKADFRAPKHLLVVGFGDIDYTDSGRGSTDGRYMYVHRSKMCIEFKRTPRE